MWYTSEKFEIKTSGWSDVDIVIKGGHSKIDLNLLSKEDLIDIILLLQSFAERDKDKGKEASYGADL